MSWSYAGMEVIRFIADPWTIRVLLFLGVWLFALDPLARALSRWVRQRRRNQLAKTVVLTDLVPKGRRAAVYLRAFGQRLPLDPAHGFRDLVSRDASRGVPVTLEEVLSAAVEPTFTLVGLGRSRSGVFETGAGLVAVRDNAWQSQLIELLNLAHLIVIVPAPTKGLTWELQQLASNRLWLRKCLCIMPDFKAERRQRMKNYFALYQRVDRAVAWLERRMQWQSEHMVTTIVWLVLGSLVQALFSVLRIVLALSVGVLMLGLSARISIAQRLRWSRVRRACIRDGLELPPYLDRGLIFVLNSDGRVDDTLAVPLARATVETFQDLARSRSPS